MEFVKMADLFPFTRVVYNSPEAQGRMGAENKKGGGCPQ